MSRMQTDGDKVASLVLTLLAIMGHLAADAALRNGAAAPPGPAGCAVDGSRGGEPVVRVRFAPGGSGATSADAPAAVTVRVSHSRVVSEAFDVDLQCTLRAHSAVCGGRAEQALRYATGLCGVLRSAAGVRFIYEAAEDGRTIPWCVVPHSRVRCRTIYYLPGGICG